MYHKDFCRNLLKLRKLSDKFVSGYVIYSGDLTPEIDGIKYLNFKRYSIGSQLKTGSLIVLQLESIGSHDTKPSKCAEQPFWPQE